MKLPPLTRQQVRGVDACAIQQFGIPGICLMENAGCGAAQVIASLKPACEVGILCGKGNNGGDGFVIARHLELLGFAPKILLLAAEQQISGDAATNLQIARASGLPIEQIAGNDLEAIDRFLCGSEIVIDAMLGTGASGNPRGVIADAIRRANACEGLRVAIDLPSGLDCDLGAAGDPCFVADHTCTFVAPKIGFMEPAAAGYIGTIHVVSIGAPAASLRRAIGES